MQGTSALVQLILANLILPEFFGVIATVAILLVILGALVDGGFGAALVQRQNITRTDISTVFYFNVATSLMIFVIMCFSSGSLAGYFKEPLLESVIPWLAFGVVLASVGQTQMQMLTKQLDFKGLALLSFPATLIGGTVGVVMALAGMNVWALVGMRLVNHACFSAGLWWKCPRELQPNFQFSFASLKRLSGLSLGILGSSLLAKITRNLIGLITMKVFGSAQMAFYTQARFFQKTPTEPLASILNRVLFPVFSEIQGDNEKIKRSLRRGIPILMFVVAPVMFFLIGAAKPLILVLLNDNWLPTVSYLRIVPVIGITFSLAAIKNNVIRSKGDGLLIFILSLARNSLSIIALYFSWSYGVMAMIIAQIVVYVFNMFLNDFFTSRYVGYTMYQQVCDWMPYVLVAAICAGVCWAAEAVIDNNWLLLTVQTVLFASLYLLICVKLRLQGFQSGWEIARQHLPSLSKYSDSAEPMNNGQIS